MPDRFKHFGGEIKTGQINPDCLGCPFAVVIEGENVEFPMMFCLAAFDFPVKKKRIKVVRQPVVFEQVERMTCRRGDLHVEVQKRLRPP